MAKTTSESRLVIELLSSAYVKNKLVILEHAQRTHVRSEYRLDLARQICAKIENTLEILDERDKFFIQKEVIEGKRGNWYVGYLTAPTYYRNREKAYKKFIDCLQR